MRSMSNIIINRYKEYLNNLKDVSTDIKNHNYDDNNDIQYSVIMGVCNGRKEITINSDGYFYPCNSLISEEFKLINVADAKNVEEIFNLKNCNMKNNTSYPENHPKCKDCKVNLFCWSCLGDFISICNDEERFQKRCNIMKDKLWKFLWNSEENDK